MNQSQTLQQAVGQRKLWVAGEGVSFAVQAALSVSHGEVKLLQL